MNQPPIWKRFLYKKQTSKAGVWITPDGPVRRLAEVYYTRRLSFRDWLLLWLVGTRTVVVNAELKGGIIVTGQGFLIVNNRIRSGS